jgi:hypothetical protein
MSASLKQMIMEVKIKNNLILLIMGILFVYLKNQDINE